MNISQIIDNNDKELSRVYFCGAPELLIEIKDYCNVKNLTFAAGESF